MNPNQVGADVHKDCPIARHSTLPELQNLFRLFRPRALSPNCVMPHLRGLDYHCMPGFFEDCMPAASSEQLAVECHQWITKRYGPSANALLQRMRKQGISLLEGVMQDPQFEDRTERVPDTSAFQYELEEKPQGLAQHKLHGRSANVADQLARIGGLPSMGMGQIISALAGASRKKESDTATLVPKGVFGEYPGMRLGQPSIPSSTRYRGHEDDYDTDEESSRRKRRRRLRSASPDECKPPDIKPELPSQSVRSATRREPSIDMANVRVKVETKPSVRGRYGVDKDRLRALASVKFEA